MKAVNWNSDGRGFIGEPVRWGALTEKRFLEILESIPD